MVELFQGQPCHRIRIDCGDTVLLAEQGAQLVSWVSGGRERLFLSPASHWDGHTAIRGGIPVCFPQFNARGSLPKHGFARNLAWAVAEEASAQADCARLTCTLGADARTLGIWPQAFEAQLRVTLRPGQLEVALAVENTGAQALQFSAADQSGVDPHGHRCRLSAGSEQILPILRVILSYRLYPPIRCIPYRAGQMIGCCHQACAFA
jgi:glucose-6-phosphate 1-epimerase